jgi:hypothetical protein
MSGRTLSIERTVWLARFIALVSMVVSCSPELVFDTLEVSAITVSAGPFQPGSVAELSVGQAVTLSADVYQADGAPLKGAPVEWRSTNAAVATVSAEGRVVAVGTGTASIRASFAGVTGLYGITVRPRVATVTLSPTSASLAPGGTQQLTATLLDANSNVLTGRAIAWSSSNAAVVAVSATGMVTAGSAGTATITATSEGRNGTATITVTSSGGLCQGLSLSLGQTLSGSLLVGDCTYPGGALYDRWGISLPSTTAVVSTLTSSVFAPATGASVSGGPLIASFERATTGSSVVEWLLPAGTYGFDVFASTLAPVTDGAYTFRVASVSSDTISCGGSVAAARGVTIGRSLGSNDCIGTRGREDRIWIYLTAGQTLTATMTSAFDAYLLLYATNGTTLLRSDDDGAGGTNARIVYTAPQTGYLQVRPTVYSSTSTGAYTISLSW